MCFRENESLHGEEMSAYIHVLADNILLLCGDSGGLCHQLNGPSRRQFSHVERRSSSSRCLPFCQSKLGTYYLFSIVRL